MVEFLALAKNFTQDPGLFELDTPLKCFKKRFEADTKSISQEMIKQASSRLKEAVESMRSQVHGVGDGQAWSERILCDKAHNLVMNIAKKTLLTLTGQLFIRKLEQLSGANGRMQRVRDLFDLKREDTESCDLIDRGLVTKFTSLMVHRYHEDKKEPNPAKKEPNPANPRRATRKYRAPLQSLADRVRPAMWKWSSAVATF